MSNSADVIVVGGGLHGLSASLHIARRGLRTVLFEQSRIGRHASGATAAGVRILNRHPAEIPLALASNRIWHEIEALVDDSCGFHSHGMVKVAENEAHLALLRERVAKMKEFGYDHEEIIDADELFAILPALSHHCAGGQICRRDGAADPFRTLRAFRVAAEQAGVAIHEGEGVHRVTQRDGLWRVEARTVISTAPFIVNAAGAWGGRLSALMGEVLPIHHMVPMMIVTEPVAPFLGPVVSVQGRKLSFKQTVRGTLLIGGGYQGVADLDTGVSEPRVAIVANGARAALDLFPSIGPLKIARIWAGIEARTEDELPIIERSRHLPGVVHVVGFSAHGFQLAPLVGSIVADLVVDGKTAHPIAPFVSNRMALMSDAAAAAERQLSTQ